MATHVTKEEFDERVLESRLRVIKYWAKRGPITKSSFDTFMAGAFDVAVERGLIVPVYVDAAVARAAELQCSPEAPKE